MNTLHNLDAAAVNPLPDLDSRRASLAALGHLYLEAGLPLAAAFEAALADFASFEESQHLCRP